MTVRIATLAALSILLAATAFANEVEELMARSIDAHGSAQNKLSKLDMQWSIDEAMIFESARPGPPWDQASVWQGHVLDLARRRYVQEEIRAGGGYRSHRSTIVERDTTRQVNHLRRTALESEQPFSGSIRPALLLSPPFLLRWLSELDPGALRREDRCQGEACSPAIVVTPRGEKESLTVLFDPETFLVKGILHGFTDYDGSYTPQELLFDDYRRQSGVLQPTTFAESFWGFTGRRGRLEAFQAGVDIETASRLPADLVALEAEPEGLRDFRVEELAPGVYLAGDGVFYQLFVEFAEYIVAMDATSGDVTRRIRAIEEALPGKPFRYVLVSHHHNDHLHGLDEYHAKGATFIAARAHAKPIRERIPDAELILVDDRLVITGGPAGDVRRLEIADIGPLPHSEHMLAGWLPAPGILFEADLFVLGGWRAPAPVASDNAMALWRHIEERGWSVKLIVDPHSPRVATREDLRKAVERREKQAANATPTAAWTKP